MARNTRKKDAGRREGGLPRKGLPIRHPDPALKKAIEGSRLTAAELSRALKVSPDAVKSWLKGKRRPLKASRRKLADFLQRHGGVLARLAAELRRTEQ